MLAVPTPTTAFIIDTPLVGHTSQLPIHRTPDAVQKMLPRRLAAARPLSHSLRTRVPRPFRSQIRCLSQADIEDPNMVRLIHPAPTFTPLETDQIRRMAATSIHPRRSASSATPTVTGGTSRNVATTANPCTKTTISSACSPRKSIRTLRRQRASSNWAASSRPSGHSSAS